MAIIDCLECKAQISDKASTCPNCGVPVQTIATKKKKEKQKKAQTLVDSFYHSVRIFIWWVLSIFCFICTFGLLYSTFLGGLSLLATSIVMNPIFHKKVLLNRNIKNAKSIRIVSVLSLFGLCLVFSSLKNTQDEREQTGKNRKQADITYVKAEKLIEKNRLKEATAILTSTLTNYESKKLEILLGEIDAHNHPRSFTEVLSNLNDSQYELLKTNRKDLKLYTNPYLNTLLIENLYQIRGKFKTMKATKLKLAREKKLRKKKQRNAKARAKKIEDQFSAWDGSHYKLIKYIKRNLNDAGSYEHVSTHYWDQGDHLIINCQYRANNAYGAKILAFTKAKISVSSGEVLEILQ